jgi:ankyrin repeat protein
MSRSGSLGGNFTKKLLYVQHVDEEKDTDSTISEQSLDEYFLGDSQIFSDLSNPKANVDILKSSLQDEIVIYAAVCTNPLPIPVNLDVTIHAFVVFGTLNFKTKEKMWYSMEKNTKNIVLQQSPVKDEVTEKLYNDEKKKLVERLGPVERGSIVIGNGKELEYLIRAIWKTKQLSTKYHLLSSNCHKFAEFVFKEASLGGKKWSTWISRLFGLRNKKSQTECPANYYEGKKWSISLNRAKGKYFTKQLLYVQHVDKEKDTASTISEQSLDEYFLNSSKIFSDLSNPKANVDILKSSLQDEKVFAALVCTNPHPATPKTAVTFHAFVVFWTENLKTQNGMWYSMETNGRYIVLQQSPNKDDVMYKLYDPEEEKLVKRLGPVKHRRIARGNGKELEYLLRAIWETNQLNNDYHPLISNCQNFASFVFEKSNLYGETWSTWISSIVDRIGLGNKKIKPEFEAETLKYNGRKDAKFVYYKAMAEGRRKDFEELVGNLTIESLNSVDSQGYTLLEWATVFSTSDWPIEQFLIKKGAKIETDEEGKASRNVFFIALQYLPSNKVMKHNSRFLSFDGIDIRGVNRTGDSALHLALNGEKWDVAERILDQFPDYDVNVINSTGYTPLHLVVHPKYELVLIKKILARTNSENVNAQDEYGWTALHDAIVSESEIAVNELLKRDNVDVNLKNKNNQTALHLACCWEDIPIELFNIILKLSTDVNAQEIEGHTALQCAIRSESEIAVKVLLRRKDVNVNLKNNDNETALHLSIRYNMPIDLYTKILEKSTDVNVQEKDGRTALHLAIVLENRTAVEELLKRNDVDVNLENNNNVTALHYACLWKNIPVDLFKVILTKLADIINAQDEDGDTALHLAIIGKNRTTVEELLKRDDVNENVNLKNNYNYTILHVASVWNNIPIDLFIKILEETTDVNAKDEDGNTALHWAIMSKSEIATNQLLNHNDVKVTIRNNKNQTAFDLCSESKDIPAHLLKIINEKTTAENNAEAKNEAT